MIKTHTTFRSLSTLTTLTTKNKTEHMPETTIIDGFTVDKDAFENFVDFVTDSDIFSTDYCGYWAYGHYFDVPLQKGVFLLYEMGDEKPPMQHEAQAAEIAVEDKTDLPDCWHIMNDETAKKIVVAGLKKYGANFLDIYDADMLDYAVQLALLGEARYS